MMRLSLLVTLAVAGCGNEPTPERWEVLELGYSASLLSVWGSSTSDVWVAGSDARADGDGMGPIVLHYHDGAWTRLDSTLRGIDLWWVYGFANGPIFFGGSGGTIMRYEAGAFSKMTTPGTSIVFGIWGDSPTDMWAVGGQFGAASGFVWHSDGGDFTTRSIPADINMNAVWKVAGRAANDVWMSCSLGAVLHWDGQALTREDVGTVEDQLFSIGVNSNVVVTLGGNLSSGHIYERVGGVWSAKTVSANDPVWRGVSVTDTGVYGVGQDAHVAHRTDSGWSVEIADGAFDAFHADWVDPDGGVWAVGGMFDRIPPIDGMLLHKGTVSIAPVGL